MQCHTIADPRVSKYLMNASAIFYLSLCLFAKKRTKRSSGQSVSRDSTFQSKVTSTLNTVPPILNFSFANNRTLAHNVSPCNQTPLPTLKQIYHLLSRCLTLLMFRLALAPTSPTTRGSSSTPKPGVGLSSHAHIPTHSARQCVVKKAQDLKVNGARHSWSVAGPWS
jgi:hypothetical protein